MERSRAKRAPVQKNLSAREARAWFCCCQNIRFPETGLLKGFNGPQGFQVLFGHAQKNLVTPRYKVQPNNHES